MRALSGVLLVLLICQLATSTPVRDGTGFQGRSTGFGETIRDWFKVLKDRIVGKWREWFGGDEPTPSLSPQDILNIDKSIGSRIPGYPGIFIDLTRLSLDPKRDWGIRIGNWYIIRKVAGNDYDSDSDEWDMRPFMPDLPSPPFFGKDWTPDFSKFPSDIPTRSPTATPKIELTTSRQQTETVTQTQPVLTSTESAVTTTEATTISTESAVTTTEATTISTESAVTTTEATTISIESVVTTTEAITTSTESAVTSTEATTTSTESIPLTTQLTTSIRPIVEPTSSSEEILTSSEFITTNSESVTIAVGPTSITTESITETSSTETTVLSVESVSSTEPTSVESIETSVESTITTTEAELTATTATESPTTSTKLTLDIYNKRVEDNETINKPRTTKKPRPASAEVIM